MGSADEGMNYCTLVPVSTTQQAVDVADSESLALPSILAICRPA